MLVTLVGQVFAVLRAKDSHCSGNTTKRQGFDSVDDYRRTQLAAIAEDQQGAAKDGRPGISALAAQLLDGLSFRGAAAARAGLRRVLRAGVRRPAAADHAQAGRIATGLINAESLVDGLQIRLLGGAAAPSTEESTLRAYDITTEQPADCYAL